ncbi:MAG: pseudoazurin [Hyphomicrobium sp.]|jgi:pseudoazurin
MGLRRLITMAAVSLACAASAATAAEHEIKIKNTNGKGKFMVFEPDFLKVAPGDTVKFTLVDKNHNAEAIKEVWPEGVEPLKGEMNQDAEFVVEKPGYYGIKCHPHYTMGMVALIVAGEPENKAQLEAFKAPGGAKKRWDELVQQIKP